MNSPEKLVLPAQAHGYVDVFGYSLAAAGWLFCGWVPRPERVGQVDQVEFSAEYDQSRLDGKATIAFYKRDDLDQRGVGVIAFLPGSSRVNGNLQRISLLLDGLTYSSIRAPTAKQVRDRDLMENVRVHLVNHAYANPGRDKLLSITLRSGFAGQDTLSSLAETVLFEVDEAILCPPHGVLLMGWYLAPAGSVRGIRVRCGHLSGDLSIADSIAKSRPDVISAIDPNLGFSDEQCGFIAYVPGVISKNDIPYVEIELENGEVGFKNLRLSKRTGMNAIRRILVDVDLRYGELDPGFDNVLGPAIRSLNAIRLKTAPAPVELLFGKPPVSPKYSLIIPLYGRIDFVEYQMALFSRHADIKNFEIIYVLDDPLKRRELEVLAQSLFERFRISMRLLLLPANLGFAPANNVGLRHAHGQYVCYLNSDVFPIEPDWMERLVGRLKKDPGLGMIGPQLLFEDGSVQHEGCYFRPIPEFGNWTFIEHFNKGRRPISGAALQDCEVITGACMVLTRTFAEELGGFDEAFIIGDFEDSDLCMKVRDKGLRCAVDRKVKLYHLERKSQIDPGKLWRMNLTLYNAWVHQRRWFDPVRIGTNVPETQRGGSIANDH